MTNATTPPWMGTISPPPNPQQVSQATPPCPSTATSDWGAMFYPWPYSSRVLPHCLFLTLVRAPLGQNSHCIPLLIANQVGLCSPVPLHLSARHLCICTNLCDLWSVMCLWIVWSSRVFSRWESSWTPQVAWSLLAALLPFLLSRAQLLNQAFEGVGLIYLLLSLLSTPL